MPQRENLYVIALLVHSGSMGLQYSMDHYVTFACGVPVFAFFVWKLWQRTIR